MRAPIQFILMFILILNSCKDSASVTENETHSISGYVYFDHQFSFESQTERYYPRTSLSLNFLEINSGKYSPGYFEFNDLAEGIYSLNGLAEGFELYEDSLVVAGNMNIDIVLKPNYEHIFSWALNDKWRYNFVEVTSNDEYVRIEKSGIMEIQVVGAKEFSEGTNYELNEVLNYMKIGYRGFSDNAEVDTTYIQHESTFFAKSLFSTNTIQYKVHETQEFKDVLNAVAITEFDNAVPMYFLENSTFNISRFNSIITLESGIGITEFKSSLNGQTFELNLIDFENAN